MKQTLEKTSGKGNVFLGYDSPQNQPTLVLDHPANLSQEKLRQEMREILQIPYEHRLRNCALQERYNCFAFWLGEKTSPDVTKLWRGKYELKEQPRQSPVDFNLHYCN